MIWSRPVSWNIRATAESPSVRLTAKATATRLRLTVTDRSRWKEAQPGADPFRGHGLDVMRALMQHVSIDRSPTGATVGMELRISP